VRSVWQRYVLAAVLVAALGSSSLAAQRRSRPAAAPPRLGAHLGYNFDVEEGLLGAQASFQIAPAFDLYPSFDFYLVSGYSLWALNFDVRYRPPTRFGAFYVGGGLNYLRSSSGGFGSSNTNLNLIGGFEARRRRTAPFAELRLTVGDGSSFQIVGGLSWRLS
jgi:hypothetical protein